MTKVTPDPPETPSVSPYQCKRSMNPTYSKIGGALSEARRASSSKAARLRNLQPRLPVAGV
ncbi:hypothetical protein ACN1C3_31315, partial [Pseudomonas sp. H11T01]|uniref:hypothetical protein n=1 Tax=Pseudomonas sp. H11T01 TaxID=3402749 RepID=UPI003AD5BA77